MMCFHIYLEEKKNETVALLYPIFLAQENNNKNDNKYNNINTSENSKCNTKSTRI